MFAFSKKLKYINSIFCILKKAKMYYCSYFTLCLFCFVVFCFYFWYDTSTLYSAVPDRDRITSTFYVPIPPRKSFDYAKLDPELFKHDADVYFKVIQQPGRIDTTETSYVKHEFAKVMFYFEKFVHFGMAKTWHQNFWKILGGGRASD